MEFTCHAQHFDFSGEDLGPVTESEAITALEKRDWSKELGEANAAEAAGKEVCPPNIEFYDHQSSSWLLVGVINAQSTFLILNAQEPARFLGIFPYTRRISHEILEFPFHRVRDLISHFFHRDFASIKATRS